MKAEEKNILNYSSKEYIKELDRHNLKEMVGKEIIISEITSAPSSNFGHSTQIIDTEGNSYYTFSMIIRRQGKEIFKVINRGFGIRVKIKINDKNQVYFVNPEYG